MMVKIKQESELIVAGFNTYFYSCQMQTCIAFFAEDVFNIYHESLRHCLGISRYNDKIIVATQCNTWFYQDGGYIREASTNKCVTPEDTRGYSNIYMTKDCSMNLIFNKTLCLEEDPDKCFHAYKVYKHIESPVQAKIRNIAQQYTPLYSQISYQVCKN